MNIAIFRFCLIALIMSLCTVFTSIAIADTIILNDGRVFEGEVLHSDDKEIRLRTVVSGIETVLTFNQSEIFNLTEGEYRRPVKNKNTDDSDQLSTTAPKDRIGGYMRVPFKGEIGAFLNTEYLEYFFDVADARKPELLIFSVDSPGGSIAEMHEILQLFRIASQNHELVFYITGRAYSAAAFLILEQDNIFTHSTALLGAPYDKRTAKGLSHTLDAGNMNRYLFEAENSDNSNKILSLLGRPIAFGNPILYCNKSISPWLLSHQPLEGFEPLHKIREPLTLNSIELNGIGISKGEFNTLRGLIQSFNIRNSDNEIIDGYKLAEQYKSKATAMLDQYKAVYEKYKSALQRSRWTNPKYGYSAFSEQLRTTQQAQRKMRQLYKQHKYIRLMTQNHEVMMSEIDRAVQQLQEKKDKAPKTRPLGPRDR